MTTTQQPETVTQAVERKDTSAGPTAMVERFADDFAKVLPSHIKPATFVRLAVGALRRDDKLRQAAVETPGSLMVALLDAARQGLEPATEQYYLVPRRRSVQGGPPQWEVVGMRGYQGEVELMYR